MVSTRREDFRRRFPYLPEELDHSKMGLRVDSVRSASDEAERAASNLSGYVPTAIDYLRRCDSEEDALSTISYLESKKRDHCRICRQAERSTQNSGPKRFRFTKGKRPLSEAGNEIIGQSSDPA